MEYLRLVGVADPHVGWLLVILSVRSNALNPVVPDGIEKLAEWSLMGDRKVQYCLHELKERGLILRDRHHVRGGPRGYAWSWTTTLVAYAQWPTEPLERLIVAYTVYLSVFFPQAQDALRTSSSEEVDAPHAPSAGKSTHRTDEQNAHDGGRGRTAARDNPEKYPETVPDVDVDVGSVSERMVKAALNVLRSIPGYPFDERAELGLLRTFAARRPRVNLPRDLQRWRERCIEEPPRLWRAALKAWLEKAEDGIPWAQFREPDELAGDVVLELIGETPLEREILERGRARRLTERAIRNELTYWECSGAIRLGWRGQERTYAFDPEMLADT